MSKEKKYVELIIFDLDGTLVDSKRDIAFAVNFTLKKLGLAERQENEIDSFIGTGINDLIRKSLGEKNENYSDKALSIFSDYFTKHYADYSTLYKGVREILDYFGDKSKIVITNRNKSFALATLKKLGIKSHFGSITGGDDADCTKPSSCSLDKALTKLDIKNDQAIMVGDMDIDVYAGKKAGVATCAVTYGIGKTEDIKKARPDYLIDDISKLKDIIK